MPSVFLDRASPPDAADLRRALGAAQALWTELRASLSEEHGKLAEKWSYAGKAYGWSLQLKAKSKTLLYLAPGEGGFTASLAIGRAAEAAANEPGFPASLRRRIEEAPRYPEGKAVRIEVRSKRDLADVRKMVALRVGHS